MFQNRLYGKISRSHLDYTLEGKTPPLKAKFEGLFFSDLNKNPPALLRQGF